MRRMTDAVAARLAPEIPAALLEEEVGRIERHRYGPYAWRPSPGRPMVVFGPGAGVYPFAYALGNPGTKLVLVEEDAERRSWLRFSAERLDLPGVVIRDSAAGAFETVTAAGSGLGVVGISPAYAGRELLRKLAECGPMDYLVGEFDEDRLNGLWLHEFSRAVAEKFHWHNRTTALPMAGRRSAGPLLSVVVPAYGVERYLDRCLESLAAQPVESLEILVVDDGARDRSGEIADRWAERDSRIRVIHQANAGCAAARRRGLRSAAGVFVGFVDGDDWADPPMFRALLESATRYGSDIAQCGYREFHESLGRFNEVREEFRLRHALGEGNGLVSDPLDYLVSKPTIWRRIYRHDFLGFHGIDFAAELPRFDDLPFQFMTLSLAERLSVIPERFYCYRQQRPGQDVAVDDERLFVHFPIFRVLRDFLDQHYTPDLERKLKLVQIATHSWGASRIARPLLEKYLAAAAHDIFEENASLSARDIFVTVLKSNRHSLPWLAGLYMRKAGRRAIRAGQASFRE